MEQQPIQWFPGHMAKARRRLSEDLKLVDMVIEIVDARIPLSSRNPDLDALTSGKMRLLALSKADMADDAATRLWVAYFQHMGFPTIALDCKSGQGFHRVEPMIKSLMEKQNAKWAAKGMTGRAIHAMVVGIPNVGKSSFINRLTTGFGHAKTENRPGVTKGNQWFTAPGGIRLLDTPGVLWPKFENRQTALHLAFTGAINDQILDCEQLAGELLALLASRYRESVIKRYKLAEPLPTDGYELLRMIGEKRGMRMSGGETDTVRAAKMVLEEYRNGKCGKITLEYPPKEENA